MKRTILAKKNSSDESLAILEDDILVEYMHQNSGELMPGTIIVGIIEEYQSSLDAYFVNIGSDLNGFLPNKFDNGTHKTGTQLILQIVRPKMGDKGALLSSKISISGKFCVINNEAGTIYISSKINGDIRRNELLCIAKDNMNENLGIIIRTNAKNVDSAELISDIKNTRKMYKEVINSKGKIGSIIYKPDGIIDEAMRNFNCLDDTAYFNDMLLFEKYFGLLTNPGKPPSIKFYDKEYDMFAFFGISNKIKEAMSRKVWLKSGGSLVFDYTEAMCVIDVNSSKNTGSGSLADTAYKTNMEAAEEIAVQIRLRNIGGIIIIDFIDMDKEANDELDRVFRQNLSKDNKKMTVGGFTALGNYEITRIRKGRRIGANDRL